MYNSVSQTLNSSEFAKKSGAEEVVAGGAHETKQATTVMKEQSPVAKDASPDAQQVKTVIKKIGEEATMEGGEKNAKQE